MSTAVLFPPASLITAEEYLHRAPSDRPSELIRGKMIAMNPPFSAHGYWCGQIHYLLNEFVLANKVGRVITNDGGVITERDPDTVRGADVAFYSFQKVPPGPLPDGYWPTPELVVEVRSSDDHWADIHKKVGEYLNAGVINVCVVDPQHRNIHVADQNTTRVLSEADMLTFPEVLPGFSVSVTRIFV